MSDTAQFENYRLILCHKHASSARTVFVRFADGGPCGPAPLQQAAAVAPAAAAPAPASVLAALSAQLGLDPASLTWEDEFDGCVKFPDYTVHVLLARFITHDPPAELLARLGASFRAITDFRGRDATEMGLLRQAFEVLVG